MLPNTSINQTELLPRVQPQSVESPPSQQLPFGYFNCLPVEVIQEIAKKLTLPDALRLKQACHIANKSIDQMTIETLMCQSELQFENMDRKPTLKECRDLELFFNDRKFDHLYKRFAYDQNTGVNENPEPQNIKCIFACMKLTNATTKYKNEKYTMYTGLFKNGHVFLIAPREGGRILEDTHNSNRLLFNGNTLNLHIDAIYSGRSFQEVKKLINIVHNNTPLSNHITHILEHEYK